MKKNILSILLVMVIFLTLTTLINSDVEGGTISPTVTTVETTTFTETPRDSIKETFSESEVKYLTDAEILEMESEEISVFFSEMVNLSETETLSVTDMNNIAHNFYNIWSINSSYDEEEFDLQSYNVFCNIYVQAHENQIPLEEISSWTNLPVPDVLCKYFYSNNFDVSENVSCNALCFLDEKDVTRVAEMFFGNPVMDTNTIIPYTLILLDYDESITNMAWMHFDELSKAVSPETNLSSYELTYRVCESLLSTGVMPENINKIVDVAESILENPYYDIQIKYMYFCNAFYDYNSNIYIDDTISTVAIDYLLNLAQNADEDTLKQLDDLVEVLNPDLADTLSIMLNKINL